MSANDPTKESSDFGFGNRPNESVAELAARICKALTIHTTIEEEIFYPKHTSTLLFLLDVAFDPEAKQSNMDLTALGAQLASRKQQLMANKA